MYLRSTLSVSIFFLSSLFLINPSFASLSTQNSNSLSNEQLCYLSGTELLELFRAKKLSPVTVLKAQIERIEKFNPNINAINGKHYEEALIQAQESERRYQNGTPRPLEGLTCAIKDEVDVKGWRTTMGSVILKQVKSAEKDCPLAQTLREAGVIMHVQTNVPEYYCNLVTWNHLFGITRNPWNTHYTPGGSSGGSSAALAAGFTTLATGSDMGGSIRFPAAMTGLYGFKPPFGRVATSLTQYESSGPMARTFEDMNLFQNALSGPNPGMLSAIKPKLNYPQQYGDIKGWRIAYDPMDKWGIPVDETIRKAMKQTVETLRSLGAEVIEVDLGFRKDDFETYALGIFSTSIGPFCFNEPEKHLKSITPYLANLVKNYAKKTSPQHIAYAEEYIVNKNDHIQKQVFSKGFKAIIMPTMTTPYVTADMGSTPENTHVTINGKQYDASTWNYSFTWPWNMLHSYPIVNVPIGMTPEKIPLGMQIIGNIYEDLNAFQVAAALSQANNPLYKGDNIPSLER